MLTYSEYKKWLVSCNIGFYNNVAEIFKKELFKDKKANRIYLLSSKIEANYQTPRHVVDFLKSVNYKVLDDIDGTCISEDTYLDKIFKRKKSPIKIGKLLKKLGKDDILKTYSENRSLYALDTKDLTVVISRHPYDLIGMSTRRRWTSCFDLEDRAYKGHYHYQLRNYYLSPGCLVAYLINKNDKNIKDPLARIVILRRNYDNSPFYKFEEGDYGIICTSFTRTVQNWIEKVNKTI